MRFLIVRLSAMGDVACTLPVASALKHSFPECEITWIVDRRFAGIVNCCTSVDQVVVAPKKISEAKQVVRALGEFSVAFDMQGLLKSAALVGFAKAEQKLGYHWQREGARLFSSPVMPDPTSLHIVDQYVDVARAAGAECERAVFNLVPKAEDLQRARDLLAENGLNEDKLIIMNAGAGWATKRWPAASFAKLAGHIVAQGRQVGFIGTEMDRPAFAEVQDLEPRVTDLLGKTSVQELVSLCSLAKLHVAGDTGSTHISAALGVPCIGLYTLTKPIRSCPYGQFSNSAETEIDKVIALADRILAGREVTVAHG